MIKKFDLRKIHRSLEFGDIKKVADAAGVTPSVVTRCLLHGWHPDHRNDIVTAALNVIKSKEENPALLKEADKMKLSTEVFSATPRNISTKFKKGNKYGSRQYKNSKRMSPWLYVAGAVVAIFVFRKKIVALLDKQTA
jgi:methylphosphotriester-DNA--protein-cysteine methyltransferase